MAFNVAYQTPDRVNNFVGLSVRRIRQKQNMTLASLAGAIGVSPQKLQSYEAGLVPLDGGLLFCISKALNVSLMSFFPETHPIAQNELN